MSHPRRASWPKEYDGTVLCTLTVGTICMSTPGLPGNDPFSRAAAMSRRGSEARRK
ncbi:hypothetical protein [Brachybacterium sacelli]|uniref:hypothetical protein n=1 Tax=Brachybacterium sacelli TaxID=173364 RepID=UPI00361EBDE8